MEIRYLLMYQKLLIVEFWNLSQKNPNIGLSKTDQGKWPWPLVKVSGNGQVTKKTECEEQWNIVDISETIAIELLNLVKITLNFVQGQGHSINY